MDGTSGRFGFKKYRDRLVGERRYPSAASIRSSAAGSRVVQACVNFGRRLMKRFAVILLATLVLGSLSSGLARETDELKDGQRLGNAKSKTGGAVKADPKAIAKLIDDINAAARTNKQRILSIIVINTDVAASTLEEEKSRNGLTLGDVYVAHSLVLATNKKPSAIFALHKSGKSWAEIARAHRVTLKGSSELIRQMQNP
jgi:hypothetical protein